MVLLSYMLIIAGCGNSSPNNANTSGSTGGSSGGGSGSGNTSGSVIELKFGTIAPPSNAVTKSAMKLKEELEKLSNGRIVLNVFHSGQLGNEGDMFQLLEQGNLDIAMLSSGSIADQEDTFSAWLMPFLVDTHEEAYELWTSKEAMNLFEPLKNRNMIGLGYTSAGFRYYVMNFPVTKPEDMSGKNLRITPSPAFIDYYEPMKVNVVPMPITEIYTSLQQGVIDGVDIDSENVMNLKLYEASKHLVPSKHLYWLCGILFNSNKWSQLSVDDQQLIQQAIQAAVEFNIDYIKANEASSLEKIKNENLMTVHEIDKEAFMPYVQNVYDKWSGKSDLIKAFIQKAQEINK